MTVLEFTKDLSASKPSSAISVKNVLYATDFSDTSEAALPYATAICRKFGARLHIAHIVSDASVLLATGGVDYVTVGTLIDDAQTVALDKLRLLTSRLGNIAHKTYVRHGQVWPNLSGIVAENEIDLMVVGTHGRTGLGKLLLGSVAEDILRHCPCPVLTIGPGVSGRAKLAEFHGEGRELAPAELAIREILCATSFTDESLQVAPVAIRLAEQFGARLTLMHVLEDYSAMDLGCGPVEDGARRLQEMVPREAELAYPPEIVIEFGPANQRIVSKAAEREVDLVVLGARPVNSTTHLPWSTVHQVVAHASCPVLTVRG